MTEYSGINYRSFLCYECNGCSRL